MKPYIIGETAWHHDGDEKYLMKIVSTIVDLRLNAIKFHLLLDVDSYITKSHPLYQATCDRTLGRAVWDKAIAKSVKAGLEVILLCNDIASIDYAKKEKGGSGD